MAVVLKCPICGQHQSVARVISGSAAQCQSCGNRFRMPTLAAAPPLLPAASQVSPQFGFAEQERTSSAVIWVIFAGGAAVALLSILLLALMLMPKSDMEAVQPVAAAVDQRPPPVAQTPQPPASQPSPPVQVAAPINNASASSESGLGPAVNAPAESPPFSPTIRSPRRDAPPVYSPPAEKKQVAWAVTVDPAPAVKLPGRLLSLTEGHVDGVCFARAPATIAVAHLWEHVPRAEKKPKFNTRHVLNICDLARGGQVKEVPLESSNSSADYEMLAVSPNGKQALLRLLKRAERHSNWLQLIDLQSGAVASEWEPVPGDISSDLSAAFIDDGSVVTALKDNLTKWNLADQSAMPVTAGSAFALSPNGKFIVAGTPDRLVFYVAATLEPCGELACRGKPAALAFNPAGDRLAALTLGTVPTLQCWKIDDGAVTADFPLGIKYLEIQRESQLQWCGSGHVLVNGKWLVDLSRGIAVWRYTASKILASTPDERCWYTDNIPASAGKSRMGLCSLALPDAIVKQRVERIYSQARQIVGPGSQISLNVRVPQVPNIPDYAQRVEAMIARQLAESQVTIAPGQAVMLEVSVTPSATGETHSFKPWGSGRDSVPPMQVAGQKVACRVAITSSGKVYWEQDRAVENVGFMSIVHLKPGENLDQHLAKFMWNHTLTFFEQIAFPGRIFDTGGTDGFGESRLRAGGAELSFLSRGFE